MDKVNIIQFTPYFPPHVGGLENVVQGIDTHWKYGDTIVFSGDMNQGVCKDKKNYIYFPSYEIIPNFPVPMFWKKNFRKSLKILRQHLSSDEKYVVMTHTRFFLSSFLGGTFSKKNKLKWIHIEHGSEYVKLPSKFKSSIAYIYDMTLGKWVLRKADIVVAISNAAEKFIRHEFNNKNVSVWHRGIDIPQDVNKTGDQINFVFIGRLVYLKGVRDLLQAYKQSGLKNKLVIFGDGDEKRHLQELSQELQIDEKVVFNGYTSSEEVIKYLKDNHCILVNPSYQEGMPTTVIEALATKNIVVATDVGGTREISDNPDLILTQAGNIKELRDRLILANKTYFDIYGKSYLGIHERFSWKNNIKKLYKIIK